MDRAEKAGLGIAVVGHAVLLAVLSLGLLSAPKPPVVLNDPLDVQLVDEVGLVSGAPEPATEAPATSEAPETGLPEEAAPAAAEPAPPEPTPTPPPPAPEPRPAPRPVPKPVPPAPAPKPTPPKPTPRPVRPAPSPKPTPAKPASAKTAPTAKPTPARTAAPTRPRPSRSDAPASRSTAKAPARPAAKTGSSAASAGAGAGAGRKTSGAALGDDFLKGITPERTASRTQAPRAATISAPLMAGLVGAIQRQLLPCADRRSSPGPGSNRITTRLRLRFNKDGSLATAPVVMGQTGTDDENGRYATRVGELAIGIARECSPLRLPAELYDVGNGQGWNDIVIRYKLPG